MYSTWYSNLLGMVRTIVPRASPYLRVRTVKRYWYSLFLVSLLSATSSSLSRVFECAVSCIMMCDHWVLVQNMQYQITLSYCI